MADRIDPAGVCSVHGLPFAALYPRGRRLPRGRRICERYAICVADVAQGLSILTLVAYIEVQYKVGFAVSFWNQVLMPLGLIMALTGCCTYRWRETKAMSLGQFLEMRYNRSFRIFAATSGAFPKCSPI